MKKMLDSITDGPRHPDEDADYLLDIVTPVTNSTECPRCKEVASFSLKRIECGDYQNLEIWGCVACGHQETWV